MISVKHQVEKNAEYEKKEKIWTVPGFIFKYYEIKSRDK